MQRAPTLEDFCEAANALYEAPTEEKFYAVVNLARESLILRGQAWDEGYQFALSQFDALPCAWASPGACTGQPVFSATPPDETNLAGWEPLYRRIAHNAEVTGLGREEQ